MASTSTAVPAGSAESAGSAGSAGSGKPDKPKQVMSVNLPRLMHNRTAPGAPRPPPFVARGTQYFLLNKDWDDLYADLEIFLNSLKDAVVYEVADRSNLPIKESSWMETRAIPVKRRWCVMDDGRELSDYIMLIDVIFQKKGKGPSCRLVYGESHRNAYMYAVHRLIDFKDGVVPNVVHRLEEYFGGEVVKLAPQEDPEVIAMSSGSGSSSSSSSEDEDDRAQASSSLSSSSSEEDSGKGKGKGEGEGEGKKKNMPPKKPEPKKQPKSKAIIYSDDDSSSSSSSGSGSDSSEDSVEVPAAAPVKPKRVRKPRPKLPEAPSETIDVSISDAIAISVAEMDAAEKERDKEKERDREKKKKAKKKTKDSERVILKAKRTLPNLTPVAISLSNSEPIALTDSSDEERDEGLAGRMTSVEAALASGDRQRVPVQRQDLSAAVDSQATLPADALILSSGEDDAGDLVIDVLAEQRKRKKNKDKNKNPRGLLA
ncbi:protein ORF89 [Cyprinid herpesvirus 3]|nr:protein ORF89 [Cyprinid herpesvirus 3]AOO33437.1 protein ORF89 [Cyprinid herpesvirus 3]